jgi:hypothetical protein
MHYIHFPTCIPELNRDYQTDSTVFTNMNRYYQCLLLLLLFKQGFLPSEFFGPHEHK